MSRALLLDTHILLWLRSGNLSDGERALIDGAPLRFASVASLWEVAILMGLKRLPDDQRLLTLPQGVEMLPVEPHHCRELAALPQIHRDPFDRMLIAQARADGLLLVTRDTKIIEYGQAGAACADRAT